MQGIHEGGVSQVTDLPLICFQTRRLPPELRLTGFPHGSQDQHELRAEPADTGSPWQLRSPPRCSRLCGTTASAATAQPSPTSVRSSPPPPTGTPSPEPLRDHCCPPAELPTGRAATASRLRSNAWPLRYTSCGTGGGTGSSGCCTGCLVTSHELRPLRSSATASTGTPKRTLDAPTGTAAATPARPNSTADAAVLRRDAAARREHG